MRNFGIHTFILYSYLNKTHLSNVKKEATTEEHVIKIVTKMIVIIVIVNQELEELRQKLEKKQVYLVNTANIVLF